MLLSKLFLFVVLLLDGNVVGWTVSFINGWDNQVCVAHSSFSNTAQDSVYSPSNWSPAQKDIPINKHMWMN